jgi:Domain of unknown function (DUF4160)
MPTLFRALGCRFHFYANEGSPREPAHVHVERGDDTAKFWIEPVVRLAAAQGFSDRDLRRLEQVVGERRAEIRRRWDEFFG